MTEIKILDESAVSEIEAVNWKKGFPDLDGDYYCRVDEYDKQPTLIRIESRSSTVRASVYEFGCGDDLRREYEAEEEYEYLGPLTPEFIPTLCATVKHLREMMADPVFGFQEVQTRLAQMQKDRDYWRTRATEAEKAAEKWYSERY